MLVALSSSVFASLYECKYFCAVCVFVSAVVKMHLHEKLDGCSSAPFSVSENEQKALLAKTKQRKKRAIDTVRVVASYGKKKEMWVNAEEMKAKVERKKKGRRFFI